MPNSAPTMRSLFSHFSFNPPANADAILQVERALGVRLPDQLRRLYAEADGLLEDLGHAAYLLPLTDLHQRTRFWWDEWRLTYPTLGLDAFVFFGSSSADHCWGIDWRHGDKIIAYHHHMEDAYEIAGTDILEVWRADHSWFEETVMKHRSSGRAT